MNRFAVEGADLAREVSDEGGHPVVQLHGLTSSRRRDRLLNLDLGLGLSGTRLLRYDARGHGLSSGRPRPEDYRWERLATDLLDLLDDVFPGEAVHGVGPSMGAATLLHAAVREPERFTSLTLMVPSTAWETRAAKADEYRAAADVVERRGRDVWVAAGRMAPRVPAQADVPITEPEITEDLLPSVLRGAAASDYPSPAEVASLTVPTTILAWTDDPAHPVSTAESLHGLLRGSTLQVATSPGELARWPARLSEDVRRAGAFA